MKKALSLSSMIVLILAILTACASNSEKTAEKTSEPVSESKKATKMVLWTFVELHGKFYKIMADSWNKANPDQQIEIEPVTLPNVDHHAKLLIALQSGVGAPDMADIEISNFPNYLKGQTQLAELNSIVDPVKDKIVQSRLDNFSKNGKYYGIDFHVGASVMYYNKELLDIAKVNPDDIVTWSDYVEAGKKVVAATGKPMTTVETTDRWSLWPLISQQGSDYLDKDGKVILDNEININTMKFLQQMVNDKVAVIAPGGKHHAEEYYGFMNKGGAASLAMPMWYMGRFTDYMPDLKGKMIIRPMPSWEKGGKRSAGMGGTGTAVIKTSKNQELAIKFVEYAKLSKEGNIQIWKQLGFDPIRTDVWDAPELKEENKFTQYFGNDIFKTLQSVKGEINTVNYGEKTPKLVDAIKKEVMFKIIKEGKDPAEVLKAVADDIRK